MLRVYTEGPYVRDQSQTTHNLCTILSLTALESLFLFFCFFKKGWALVVGMRESSVF